jgi:hypothetical protein
MRATPPRFIHSRTYALFFHGFPVVPGADFWHNYPMPTRDEKNAEPPHAVLPPAAPEPAPAMPLAPAGGSLADRSVAAPAHSATDPNASPRPREIGGPTGPEPTRFGDWEKKGRCIDF